MRFRLIVLGEFSLVDTQTEETISLRSNARLIACLALSPVPVERGDLAERVWPGVENAARRNRLRVALSVLRTLAPGLVDEQNGRLSLSVDHVLSDASESRRLVWDAENSVSERDELATLIDALEPWRLGTGWHEWISLAPEAIPPAQAASRRACELAQSLGDDSALAKAVQVGILLDPDEALFWVLSLHLGRRRGTGPEAAKTLRATAPAGIQENEEIRSILEDIRADRPAGGLAWTPREADLLLELIWRLHQSDSTLLPTLLMSPPTLQLAGEMPRVMHDLLARILTEAACASPDADRARARMVGLKAWLNDAPGVLEAGLPLLEQTDDMAVKRATWNAVAVAYSILRQWPEAMDAIDRARELALEMGNELNALSARGNRAFFLMHQAKFEEAEREYEESLAETLKLGTDAAKFEYAIGFGNSALLPVLRGDWAKGRDMLKQAIARRKETGNPLQMGLLQAALSLCHVRLGEGDDVVTLMRAGFVDAFQSGSDRFQQITFEFAAAALASEVRHQAYAAAICDWVDSWRGRTGLARGQAEQDFIARWVPRPSGTAVSLNGLSAEDVGREVMRRLRSVAARSN